jgi:hypothetical protein
VIVAVVTSPTHSETPAAETQCGQSRADHDYEDLSTKTEEDIQEDKKPDEQAGQCSPHHDEDQPLSKVAEPVSDPLATTHG